MRGKESYIDYLIYFLPVEWMKDVLLGITSNNIEGSPVIWGKMLTYLGVIAPHVFFRDWRKYAHI